MKPEANYPFLHKEEENLALIAEWFRNFYPVGADESGGVTRLGYTKNEDIMHGGLRNLARKLGLQYSTDEAGNTYIFRENREACWLIGSHLDSVVNGGRYDGVSGIIAGLLILKWFKDYNIPVPLKLCAFRCEESSMFGIATVGSSLLTHKITAERLKRATNKEGVSLYETLKRRGYSPECKRPEKLKGYLELHIEQGRVLELQKKKIGIVTDIAAPTRYWLTISGRQDHTGATPMDCRLDALAAAAEIILALENLANREKEKRTVGTVGYLDNYPNAFNVISGKVKLGIDIRGIDKKSIDSVAEETVARVTGICGKRGLQYDLVNISADAPVRLSETVMEKCREAAAELGESYLVMPSGAGHDAMEFADICPTGMVFIPCKDGVSHNKEERIEYGDLLAGTRVLCLTLLKMQE
ncbi:MAG: M20 family metallo-hydrolase [Fusobacteriaceae bacterium]|nr:M20 family metallo-hydrolase [Fusobacteriaceae bacterium]